MVAGTQKESPAPAVARRASSSCSGGWEPQLFTPACHPNIVIFMRQGHARGALGQRLSGSLWEECFSFNSKPGSSRPVPGSVQYWVAFVLDLRASSKHLSADPVRARSCSRQGDTGVSRMLPSPALRTDKGPERGGWRWGSSGPLRSLVTRPRVSQQERDVVLSVGRAGRAAKGSL